MNKMYLFLGLGFILFLVACQSNKNNLDIEILFTKIDTGRILVVSDNISDTSRKASYDTLLIKNGKVHIKREIPDALLFELLLFTNNPNVNRPYKSIFLEPGKVTVEVKDSLFNDVVVTGSASQKDMEAYAHVRETLDKEYQSIGVEYEAVNKEKKGAALAKEASRLEKKADSLDKVKLVLDSIFIVEHKNSKYVPYILIHNLQIEQFSISQSTNFINLLSKEVQNSFYAKKLKHTIDATLTVGMNLKSFTLPDTAGKSVNLSDFKGKVVLLDFWASWCVPCREANPALVTLYNKYHSLGLEIIGVSLDSDKAEWIKAIKQDKLPWTHVGDLQGWENSVALEYNVKYIPYTIIIDKEGKIIYLVDKTPRNQEDEDNAQKKLKEVLAQYLNK